MAKIKKEFTKTLFYKLQFIDGARLMASSLSNLVNNLAERIHKTKCKYVHYNEKCKTCGIKYNDCEYCLIYANLKDNLIEYNCLYCNKNYLKNFDEILKERFANFLTIVSISLFYCSEKVFTHRNIWVIGKNLVKLYT